MTGCILRLADAQQAHTSVAEWLTRTPWGTIRHDVLVWTDKEWRRLPEASRPGDAVLLDNGCHVRMQSYVR